VTACGGSDGTAPADVNTMTKNAGDGQNVVVGEAAPVAPSVRITNQNQTPVPNVAVTFAVASGGGQVSSGSTTTNASGIATAGSWTMGTTPGPNTLTATATGINGSPVTFTATAIAGAPKTITKQAGDNQTASPTEAVAVKPAVKVVDQFGNPVAGVTVTFAVASGGGSVTAGTATTGADGVATVGDWILGANEGANTLTATVAGSGITGNPASFTATAQFVAFNPTSSTTITGNKTYSSVNIPAGVTLTINSDAVITVLGDYTQAGVVNAPCHTLRIDATGLLTVSGNIANDCIDPDAEGNDLVLIGRGGYNVSNNEIASSGDIWIMDGPTLSLDAIGARVAANARVLPNVLEAGPYRCRLVNMTLRARPLTKKKKPTKTSTGDPGSSGTSRTSGCGQLLSGQFGGNLLVDGVTMIGGSGGDGGDGISSSATLSQGGVGGEPGALNLVSDGDLDIQGTVTLTLGNGGNGGNATSTVTTAGVSATATGGKGSNLKPRNFSSPVTILSKRGTLTVFGGLKVEFGTAGAGGTATANGGDGAPGAPKGQKGGDATANGGNGGDAEAWSLVATGNVQVFGSVNVSGGAGGAGGHSIRKPGAGGPGSAPGAAGGDGGNALGRGGNGGRGQPASFVANANGPVAAPVVLQSPGGAGGNSTSSGGKGGDGVPNCPSTGGSGGKGGDASGGGGDRGAGVTAGAIATVTFDAFGNGGNGKAGNGAAGAGGANNTTVGSGVTGVPAAPGSFQPGLPGGPCPSTNVTVNLTSSTPTLSQGLVQPGTYAVQLRDAATNAVVGAMNFIAQGTTFYGATPPRIGWSGANGSWLQDLGSAMVNGAPWKFTSWRVCIINTQVSTSAPVLVEELDANMNVLAFRPLASPIAGEVDGVSARQVTSLLPCQDFLLQAFTRYIRLRMSGLGSSADANAMGGTGGPIPSGAQGEKRKGGF
jgi:hypothetical protein